MFTIGITGGTGAGKTSALRALESLGAFTLDCDLIYHELLATNADLRSELEVRFKGVLIGDKIDRKRLGEIVFSDPDSLTDLSAITRKYTSTAVAQRIAEYKSKGVKVIGIDAIALIESGRAKECDVVVGVAAPREVRITRIMERDRITREQAEMRASAQKPDSFYREHCDYMLEGICAAPGEFEHKCKEFFAKLIGEYENAG